MKFVVVSSIISFVSAFALMLSYSPGFYFMINFAQIHICMTCKREGY